MGESRRLAVYAAPRADSELARRAERWLSEAGALLGLDGLTSAARHYGFHGTLVPPFRLAPEVTPAVVREAVRELAAGLAPVVFDSLVVGTVGRFVALVPRVPNPSVDALAARCVRDLDPLRRRPTDAELERRRASGLSPQQDRLLTRWGYPYVLEEFRYHMTLSRTLSPGELEVVVDAARAWFGNLDGEPFVLDSLCLFEQLSAESDFVEVARYPLTGDE